MSVSVRVDVLNSLAVTERLTALGRQMPFALATALNDTANSAQQAVRDRVRDTFSLRRPDWVLKTIYRKPGEDFADRGSVSKGRAAVMQAAVRIREDQNVLAKHERGGPLTGERRRAIPIDPKRNKHDIIPRGQRPGVLLGKPNSRAYIQGAVVKIAEGRGKNARVRALFLLKRTVQIRPQLQFVETASAAAVRTFPEHASRAIQRTLATAR